MKIGDMQLGGWGWAGGVIRSPAAYALILLFALALYLPGLTRLPAIDRDEARFAQGSRQMLESGDFIDIRNGTQERLKKPAGIYWLQAAATKLAGGEDPANPIWTYRLPGLIGAIGAVLVTLAIGRRWMGAEPGFVGAALLAVAPVLGYEARQADTDAFLLLTIVVAIAELAVAWIPGAAGEMLPRRRWITFWIAIGAGLLIKGPVILLVVGLTAATLAILDRGWRWMGRLRPWPGVAIAAVMVLPWFIAIMIATKGAFLRESLGTDLGTKLAGGQESHGALPGTYLLSFAATFWPGSLFAALAAPWVWRNRRDRAVLFCLAWLIPSWIVFELVPTKLPRYVMPLFPAIALLAASALANRLPSSLPTVQGLWVRRILIAIWSLVGIALGGAMAALAPLADHRLSITGLAAAVALWALTAAGAWTAWRNETRRATAISLGGAVVAWGLVFGAALPALDAPWIAPRLKEALFEKQPAGSGPLLIAGYAEPSALIAFGTATQFGNGADAAKLLGDTAGATVIVGGDQQAAFDTAIADAKFKLDTLTSISGFNYAKGKRLTLTAYRRSPQ